MRSVNLLKFKFMLLLNGSCRTLPALLELKSIGLWNSFWTLEGFSDKNGFIFGMIVLHTSNRTHLQIVLIKYVIDLIKDVYILKTDVSEYCKRTSLTKRSKITTQNQQRRVIFISVYEIN